MVLLFISVLPSVSGQTLYTPLLVMTGGRGVLQEDLSIGSYEVSVLLDEVYGKSSIRAGISREQKVFLMTVKESRFKGEYITVTFRDDKGYVKSFSDEYSSSLLRLRSRILLYIEGITQDMGEPGIMLDSLLLGRTYRAGQLKEEFRLAGLSHLLALSGLHLGIVSTLVFLILRFILPCRARGPVLLMLLCFYSYLIGLKHSFLRAVIMYGLFSLLQLKDIKPVSWKVMVLSALIQSFIWKGSYRSWSFILSYAAMGGILGFYRPWLCVFRRILPKVLALPLAVSCAAQTVIIPLVLPFFGWIQPVGVIAGLILTPLITVYLWAGLLYIPLIMIFPGLKDWGAGFFRVIHELIMILVRFFGRVSPVQWESPAGKLLFFLTLSATIVPFVLLLVKEVRFGGKKSQIKLRFPFGNKSTFGNDGAGAQKEMGAEFSHQ